MHAAVFVDFRVGAEGGLPVGASESEVPLAVDGGNQVGIDSRDGSAFHGVEDLGCVEAKGAGFSTLGERLPLDTDSEGMGCIEEQAQVVTLGERFERIDVTGLSIGCLLYTSPSPRDS